MNGKRDMGDTIDWDVMLAVPVDPAWTFTSVGFESAREGDLEAQLSVANGLIGVRGSLEQPLATSQPRSYIAGLFDQPESHVISPTLLPAPDWTMFRVTIDGQPCAIDQGETLTHVRTLDLRRALLLRTLHWRSPAGKTVRLETTRFAAQTGRGNAVQVVRIIAEQPAQIAVDIVRQEPAPPLQQQQRDDTGGIWRTGSGIHWLVMHETHGWANGPRMRSTPLANGTRWEWHAETKQPAILWRHAAFARADDEASMRAAANLMPMNSLASLYEQHVQAWGSRWHASDIDVGEHTAQHALRFAIYHLLSAANPEDDRVSVGARALTGDGYHGHVFWDTEIFLLPFYTFTWPEAARAMLTYRYHTLPAARAKAARLGFRGAFYAWESADTGEEATPRGVIGPDGKEVVFHVATDETHISADIAYAVWQYWQVTGDDTYFRDYGAEILLETARFWASRATPDADGRYHIRAVIGPDEYHERVDDNAYTNVMAQWNMRRGIEAAGLMQERWPEQWAALRPRISLGQEELDHWRDVADRMATGFAPERGMHEQFAGFFGLEYIDLATFTPRTPYMDVALGHDRTQRSQVIKQADVVMLMALLWDDMPAEVRATNFHYYAPRCSQGSSLSPAMHALVAARLGDHELALRYFAQAVAVDLGNSMGNAADGVHIATLGGMWQAAVLGFAGMRGDAQGLHFDPHVPALWVSMQFRVQWRGQQVKLSMQAEPRVVTATLEHGEGVNITVGRLQHQLSQNEPWTCYWEGEERGWVGTT